MTTAKCDRLDAIRSDLEEAGQSHVLAFFETLDEAGRKRLLAEVEAIDWRELAMLVDRYVHAEPAATLPSDLAPPAAFPRRPVTGEETAYARARRAGEALVRSGKVAVFSVAGGQGSRLGHDAPKGTFPATPIRKRSIFGVIAESIRKTETKYGGTVPWYLMTSRDNDRPTRAFFEAEDYFGLDPKQVMMFPQGMMPAIDVPSGRVLLAAPDALALSPNGHGGALRALIDSGAVDDMERRGIEQLSYTQVDNPLARVVDPLFLGLHVTEGCQMSSKALPKTASEERVGIFAQAGGKVMVIEYSDMPTALATACEEDGQLTYRLGSIAMHAIAVEFIATMGNRSGGGMAFHRAEKKVDHIDPVSGDPVRPKAPNAVKLEMFVFDALPRCERSIIYETDRVEEFAPIKNADAANPQASVDSPFTSCMIQVERAGRWLEAHGVDVPRDNQGRVDATIEISPLTAIEPDDLAAVELPRKIAPGASLVI